MIKYNLKQAGPNLTSREIQEIELATAKLTEESVEYTSNGEYEILPPEGFDGLSKVNVEVNVECPTTTIESSVTSNGTYTYTAPEGYDALESVTVDVDVQPTTTTLNVSSNGDYYPTDYNVEYFDSVNVDVPANWGQQLTTYRDLFKGNTALTSSDLVGFVGSTLATDGTNMFQNCSALDSVTLDVSGITGPTSSYGSGGLDGAFQGCNNLQSVTFTGWSTNIKSFINLFYDCTSLTSTSTIDISGVNDFNGYTQSYVSKGLVGMFRNCRSLTAASITGASCPNLTSTKWMFNGCQSLVEAPLFDTSNVREISSHSGSGDGMFQNCRNLTTVPLYDFGNVMYMQSVFDGCSSLTTIPQFNTSNVVEMRGLFRSCSSLQSVPLLDASKVSQVAEMFYNCTTLTTLGGFTNMGKAFTANHTWSLEYSSNLTYQSAMNIINNLATPDTAGITPTLKLNSNVYNLLSASDIAIATAKGWSVTA